MNRKAYNQFRSGFILTPKFGVTRLRRGGFTLFESILYIAIVSVFLVSVSYLVIDIMGSQTKSASYEDVTYYQNFIVDQLARDVRQANDITTLTAQTLVLAVPGGLVTYNFDSTYNRLTRQVGSGSVQSLASDAMAVSGSFANQSFMNRSKIVGVELFIATLNPGSRKDFTVTSSVTAAFELRGRR